MSSTASSLAGRMIFNFGARRSGTFWLQRIVTAHPEVAEVPGETMFFACGIAPLFECFHHAGPQVPSTGRIYADRELLLDATRDFSDRILGQYAEPGTTRIAERSPWHVKHLELMGEIYPDACYVHIVRDGRDAARSLASMDWFPGSLEDAALEWRESVLAAREHRRPDHYLELRYEELLSDPEPVIRKLFEWLGLKTDSEAVEAALGEARVERNNDAATAVGAEKWRRLMSSEEQAMVLDLAGDALAAYGYESAPTPGEPPVTAGRATGRHLLRRIRRSAAGMPRNER